MLRRIPLSVAALAAAALLLESTLTRLLAVAQFYHFAFLVVSLALLGFGASGTLLSLAPRLGRIPIPVLQARTGVAFAASTGLAYAVVNFLPFDSYSIAWDRRQILYFVCYYLALTLPFLCAGLGYGAGIPNVRWAVGLNEAEAAGPRGQSRLRRSLRPRWAAWRGHRWGRRVKGPWNRAGIWAGLAVDGRAHAALSVLRCQQS